MGPSDNNLISLLCHRAFFQTKAKTRLSATIQFPPEQRLERRDKRRRKKKSVTDEVLLIASTEKTRGRDREKNAIKDGAAD